MEGRQSLFRNESDSLSSGRIDLGDVLASPGSWVYPRDLSSSSGESSQLEWDEAGPGQACGWARSSRGNCMFGVAQRGSWHTFPSSGFELQSDPFVGVSRAHIAITNAMN